MPNPYPPHYENWKPRRQRRWDQANNPPKAQRPVGPPQMPTGMPPRPDFLPATPGYESAQRGANDALTAQLAQINAQRGMLPGIASMFKARQGTDVGYQTSALNESLADRGIFDSTVTPYLQQRDIDIPATRSSQDFALNQQQQYSQLAGAESESYLDYNQALMEALLQRAADAAGAMPLGLPQWGSNFGTPVDQRPERKPRRKPKDKPKK